MSSIPATVSRRFGVAVPRFKKILAKARERDVNESDTVTIVMDMLEEVFGFDRYSEITREYCIQGTYCDLATKTSKGIEYLIEVKAIGLEMTDKHIRQAVNYAAREGIKWVVLTNGRKWEIHRVSFGKAVQNERLFVINFMDINPRQKEHQDLLFLLCKRGVKKDLIGEYYEHRRSVNRYTIGAFLLTDAVTTTVRRELRKLKPGIKVTAEEIKGLIQQEVIKREILDSEAACEAQKQVSRFIKKQEKGKSKPKGVPVGSDSQGKGT